MATYSSHFLKLFKYMLGKLGIEHKLAGIAGAPRLPADLALIMTSLSSGEEIRAAPLPRMTLCSIASEVATRTSICFDRLRQRESTNARCNDRRFARTRKDNLNPRDRFVGALMLSPP
jgi:hypothetical protein